MEYKGYLIEEDKTGYAPKHLRFSYFSDDGEKYWGMEETIEDCQKQIDELIIDKIKSILQKDFGWENLNYEDKKWFIDELIKDVHSICIGKYRL